MLWAVLANLRARALRTGLTVGGIGIGILALVVVGSLAERLETIVSRSGALNTNAVFAVGNRFGPEPSGAAADSFDRAARRIRTFAGVRDVVPEVIVPYGLTPPGAGGGGDGRFGPPVLVFGFPPAARAYAQAAPRVGTGRDLVAGDARAAVVGADFAAAAAVGVGSTIAIYGNSFEVVGIIEKSFTLFDAAIVVPFAQAQKLMLQAVPPTSRVLPRAPATALMVIVTPHADTGILARRINVLTSLHAQDPQAVAASFASVTSIFDAIIFGAALIALVVGAFSIVNTMTIAVTERTREIGIRKAIGAGDGDILREFLLEAVLIGALGAMLGIGVGCAIVAYVNARNASVGSLELFAVTPRLVAGSFAFALVLTAAAGFIPAWAAARLQPTEALRRNG